MARAADVEPMRSPSRIRARRTGKSARSCVRRAAVWFAIALFAASSAPQCVIRTVTPPVFSAARKFRPSVAVLEARVYVEDLFCENGCRDLNVADGDAHFDDMSPGIDKDSAYLNHIHQTLRTEVGRIPGIRMDPDAEYRVVIQYAERKKPGWEWRSVCLPVGTLFIFPMIATKESLFVAEIRWKEVPIGHLHLAYSRSWGYGWLVPLYHLFVTPFSDETFMTRQSDLENQKKLFEEPIRRLAHAIADEIQSHQTLRLRQGRP